MYTCESNHENRVIQSRQKRWSPEQRERFCLNSGRAGRDLKLGAQREEEEHEPGTEKTLRSVVECVPVDGQYIK